MEFSKQVNKLTQILKMIESRTHFSTMDIFLARGIDVEIPESLKPPSNSLPNELSIPIFQALLDMFVHGEGMSLYCFH